MKRRCPRRSIELSLALAFTALALMACVKLSVFQIWDELVNGSLEISPSFVSLRADQKVTLSASGGSPGYKFVLVGGGGTLVDGLDGRAEYTAPGSDTEAAIRLTDAAGAESEADILVKSVDLLTIQPSSAALLYGETQHFIAVGGLSPYEFSLVSGLGSVSTAGLYTAPASEDTDAVVRVEDDSGQSSEATVMVRSAPQPLAIDPTSLTIEAGSTFTFTFSASGGTPPYNFNATAGTINSGTGEYTAPGSEGGDTVTVTDSALPFAATATASVTVTAFTGTPLQIVPLSINVKLGATFQFEALGGDGSFMFTMQEPPIGSITPDGLYSAPPIGEKTGNGKVILTDGRGISVIATVKVKK